MPAHARGGPELTSVTDALRVRSGGVFVVNRIGNEIIWTGDSVLADESRSLWWIVDATGRLLGTARIPAGVRVLRIEGSAIITTRSTDERDLVKIYTVKRPSRQIIRQHHGQRRAALRRAGP